MKVALIVLCAAAVVFLLPVVSAFVRGMGLGKTRTLHRRQSFVDAEPTAATLATLCEMRSSLSAVLGNQAARGTLRRGRLGLPKDQARACGLFMVVSAAEFIVGD